MVIWNYIFNIKSLHVPQRADLNKTMTVLRAELQIAIRNTKPLMNFRYCKYVTATVSIERYR